MPTRPAKRADEIAGSIGSIVDRLVDAKVARELAQRGQEVAAVFAERGADLGDRAADLWKETRPARRDTAKALARARRDAASWSDDTWRSTLRPALKDLWKRRTVAIGAAGAAVPAGRELAMDAAARLGIKRREERHWGAFFFGMIIGAAVGAVVAMLTAPKPGREMRRELTTRAGEVRDEIAARARDADWVPLFEREGQLAGNGRPEAAAPEAIPPETPETPATPARRTRRTRQTESAAEGAAGGSSASGSTAEQAAEETAEAINESFQPEPEPQPGPDRTA